MASLKPRMKTSWSKGQSAMKTQSKAYRTREDFFTNRASKLPIAVKNSQQKMTRDIVISLPWNWLRNSRMVISWTAIEDMPVPIMDQMIKRFTLSWTYLYRVCVKNPVLPQGVSSAFLTESHFLVRKAWISLMGLGSGLHIGHLFLKCLDLIGRDFKLSFFPFIAIKSCFQAKMG